MLRLLDALDLAEVSARVGCARVKETNQRIIRLAATWPAPTAKYDLSPGESPTQPITLFALSAWGWRRRE